MLATDNDCKNEYLDPSWEGDKIHFKFVFH